MKRFLLCLAFGFGAVPACAQAPVGSRVLKSAEMAGQTWPTFSRVESESTSTSRAVQFLLRNVGFYRGTPDGIFGIGTKRAVKAFQRAKGLKVDGAMGAQTWGKLCPRLRRGDRGDAVRALQTLLAVKADGVFGYGTETALRREQKNLGASVDGVAGAQTWAALVMPPE